jgi:hypothetical protein
MARHLPSSPAIGEMMATEWGQPNVEMGFRQDRGHLGWGGMKVGVGFFGNLLALGGWVSF